MRTPLCQHAFIALIMYLATLATLAKARTLMMRSEGGGISLGSAGNLEDLGYMYGSDKSRDDHNYVTVYDELFADTREQVKSVVEVGIATGQSLQMWQDFFPNANIKGVDVNVTDLARSRFAKSTRVHLLTANSQSAQDVATLGIPAETVDILIDDGDHTLSGQQRTLAAMWPLVRAGGHYIIEDVEWKREKTAGESLWSLLRPEEGAQYPILHHEMLENTTNYILEHNDAFFADTSLGHRDWGLWAERSGPDWVPNRDEHNSHLVIIRKRDRPLHPIVINYGTAFNK